MVTVHREWSKAEVLKLTAPCSCEACSVGCTFGSGVLEDSDVGPLAKHLKVSEDKLKEQYLEEIEKFHTKKFKPKVTREKGKPYGTCIFYDKEKGCTVHDAKPTECKIAMGCKDYGTQLTTWFMINTFLNVDDPHSVREYASYVKNGGHVIAGAELHTVVPDEKKLKAMLSYKDLHYEDPEL